MTVEQMRDKISKVYDGITWKDKVRRMADNQVIAIYHSFLSKGKFDKKKPIKVSSEPTYQQTTIFDYMAKKGVS